MSAGALKSGMGVDDARPARQRLETDAEFSGKFFIREHQLFWTFTLMVRSFE